MTALVFVDTNVLIYAQDSANLEKQQRAQAWRRELWKTGAGRISFQVLQEFYVNVAQKWPNARRQAREEVRDLLAWQPVRADGELMERAWEFQDRYQLSF
jgi:predicted nucleic acid-binding protein